MDDNMKRDYKNQEDLARLGWKFLIVWECQLNDPIKLSQRIRSFLID